MNLAPTHPKATTALLTLAIIGLVGLYTAVPDLRDAALPLLTLVLMGGLFSLRPREVRILAGVAMVLLALAVISLWRLDSGHFDPVHEGLSALMVLAMIPAVGFAVQGFAQRMAHAEAERQALTSALADMSMAVTCDPLTGLFNDRHMRECMSQEARRCQRAGTPLSVGVMDIDGLRRLNEQLGFEIGDEALRLWSQTAREVFRQTDVVGRWRAEQFIVLFADSSTEQAALGIERLRQSLSQRHVGHLPCPGFSAGLVDWPAEEPIDAVIERACSALRQAKSEGGARCVVGIRDTALPT